MTHAHFGLSAVTAALILPLLAPAPATAVQIYTHRATWEAALAATGHSVTTDAFNANIAAPVGVDTISFDSGVVSTGLPAAGQANNSVFGGSYDGAVDAGFSPLDIYDVISWSFPGPVIAFGADWFNTTSGGGLTLTGNFDGTGDQTFSFLDELGISGDGFLGVIGLAPFTSITLSHENLGPSTFEQFNADNLSFAPTRAALPEPTTLALLGASLAALGLRRRAKR